MDDPESGEVPDGTEGGHRSRATGAGGGGDRFDGSSDRRHDRYRAVFEGGQLVVAEFDCSAAMSEVADIAAETDDLVAYLDDNPADHERILDRIRVTDVNRRAVEYYGADSKEQLAENLDEIMTPESLDTWKRVWARLLDGDTGFRRECVSRTFDGERRSVLTEWTVPEDDATDHDRVYMIALDITDRLEREERLERRNELLDEFASVVSHDIATPLGVIENNAQLIELTGDTARVEGIYDAVERIREMTDELLALAQDGGSIDDTGPVGLGDVARDAWQSIETGGATLTVEETGVVEANRNRLRQLLENLVRNAVEHGSRDTDGAADPVTVAVGLSGDGFYVADDGVGVPESDRERLFEQGYTTEETGTGLGLAIVRRIADGHGWDVRVTENGDAVDGAGEAGGVRVEITGVQVYDGAEDLTRYR